MAKIIINRKGQWRNRMRAIKVFIDGNQVGTVKNDSSEEFVVPAGHHTVQCKIDWCSCKPFDVDLKEDEVKMLRLESGMKFYSLLTSIVLLIIFGGFFYSKLMHRALPDWWYWGQVGFCGLVLLYLAYYLSIGRDRYLMLSRDDKSIFN